ncbi:hypothetical protein PGT21_001091 [Puccinia graminis f. sp. tritici]|uniref:RlpA-like protein double-psi beta-barrel domain-containing protein n=1 Tax=Puccinia graminis f. sp. tritici TaxID=56615 RepID=A0A5B0MKW8_PUCGR|nr:hypothetical protein PGT21_001091 [Puccinia graminis f. sp. tritici]
MALRLSAILFYITILITQFQLGLSAQTSPQQRLTKRGHPHSLQKRAEGSFAGKATFFDPGLGACGGHNGPDDFIVALNVAQYTANKWCNKKIKIFFGGKSTVATITDECPGCPPNGLDMSPSLFEFFASKDVGVFYMSWSLLDGDSDEPKPEPKPAPAPPPPPPQPQPQPSPPKTEDKPPPPKDEDQPPAKDQDQPPPKKDENPPPPKQDDTPKKEDSPPPYKPDPSPQYTSNPFTAFQSTNSAPLAGSGSALLSRPNSIPTTSSSTVTTASSSTGSTSSTSPPITYPAPIQYNPQSNPYAPGGNLDTINQLVISFGSLAAASAGNALNVQG